MKSVGISSNYYKPHIIDADISLLQKNVDVKETLKLLHLPTAWTAPINLNQYVDTPMHLIFQGVVKSVIEFSFMFLTHHRKKQEFKSDVYDVMDAIKMLQCTYCAMETFTMNSESFVAGWIAEHYVAISRCFVHIMSHVMDLISTDNVVSNYFELMIQSLMCLVYNIMTPYTTDLITLDNYIKCFLQSVHYFETYSNMASRSTSSYIWFSRGNFLSLLNLPDQIEQFGSIRLYWEGTSERYIQYVKPLMKNIRNTTSYLAIQFHNLQQSNTLNHISELYGLRSCAQTSYLRNKNIKIYPDQECIENAIKNHEPFLCLHEVASDINMISQIFVVVKNANNDFHKIQIACDDNHGKYICGQWYTQISIKNEIIMEGVTTQQLTERVEYISVIAIPQVLQNHDHNAFYAFANEHWQCRTCNGKMALPKISQELIQSLIK